MEHALLGVIATNGQPIAVCACLALAAGKPEVDWSQTVHDDGTISVTPSLNWKGHFHVVADHAPRLEWDERYHADDSTDGIG